MIQWSLLIIKLSYTEIKRARVVQGIDFPWVGQTLQQNAPI